LLNSIYQHQLDRLKILSRASLTTLVFEKSLKLHSTSSSSDDGRVLALIATDAEALIPVAEMLHETWAHLVEVIVGMVSLLYTIGWTSLLLLLSIYGKAADNFN
jgi:hypothetical protein